jgi:hypothetical protein
LGGGEGYIVLEKFYYLGYFVISRCAHIDAVLHINMIEKLSMATHLELQMCFPGPS